MNYNTPRVNRLKSFKYLCSDYCKETGECVAKRIVEEIINEVSNTPHTSYEYLQGYEDGYTKALDKIARLLVEAGKGAIID